ncbi:hypothetical protein F5Y03DRAFT_378192 [Xylaria venustula]|nr:hypothetical protein F5Y03DRAFT_378192 [Xylaria venustula]
MSWRKNPTPENHHGVHTPYVDWDRDPTWEWPFDKLSYPHPDVLWSSLHAKFNCMPFAIQDPYAWHSDVCELAWTSENKEEFEEALLKRRDERFQEIREYWKKATNQLGANPIIWKAPPRGPDRPWATFCRIGRHFSFDAIVGHFSNYLVEDTNALYREDAEARNANAASTVAVTAASVPSSTPAEQSEQTQQPAQDFAPPFPPTPPPPSPPAAAAAASVSGTKARPKRVSRTRKGPANRSRVETPPSKPPSKPRTRKPKPQEGVRRSARLQERAASGST